MVVTCEGCWREGQWCEQLFPQIEKKPPGRDRCCGCDKNFCMCVCTGCDEKNFQPEMLKWY